MRLLFYIFSLSLSPNSWAATATHLLTYSRQSDNLPISPFLSQSYNIFFSLPFTLLHLFVFFSPSMYLTRFPFSYCVPFFSFYMSLFPFFSPSLFFAMHPSLTSSFFCSYCRCGFPHSTAIQISISQRQTHTPHQSFTMRHAKIKRKLFFLIKAQVRKKYVL